MYVRSLALAIVVAWSAFGATIQERTVQLVLFPQNQVAPTCPMKTAVSGSPTTAYSTAVDEGNAFQFSDFLPTSTAVLSRVSVTLSTLGQCSTPNQFSVHLNQGFAGVDPLYTTIGTYVAPSTWTSGCTDSKRFEESERGGPSLITPTITPYVRGGQNVINVYEQPTGTCSSFIEYVTVTLFYYDDLPVITFDLSPATSEDQRKVLMNRWRTEAVYGYPSTEQQAAATVDHLPDSYALQRDSHVRIRGTATTATGAPVPNLDFYIRVIDPPDPSTYMPAAERHRGDNVRGQYNLFTRDFEQYLWQRMSTDANGVFQDVLQTQASGAGDNIQLEASAAWLPYPEQQDRCTPALGCYKSGVLTAWRRLYIERDRMFRRGTFLKADAVAGATTLSVVDASQFSGASVASPIAAILVHGDGPEITTPANYYEVVMVTKSQTGKLTLQAPIVNNYYEKRSVTLSNGYSGDAIGRYSTTADLWPTYLDPAVNYFGWGGCASPPACDSLYVDARVLNEGPNQPNRAPYIPFIPTCPAAKYCIEVAERYFDSRNGSATLPGHTHFVAATMAEATTSTFSGIIGNTYRDNDQQQASASGGRAGGEFIWNRSIELAIGGASPTIQGLPAPTIVEEVSAHELVHFYDVNPPAFGTGATFGHCTNDPGAAPNGPLASNGAGYCVMNGNRTRANWADGRFGLHIAPWGTSEYRRIRARWDPITQTWQPAATPLFP